MLSRSASQAASIAIGSSACSNSAATAELLRRTERTHFPDRANLMVDADLWLEPEAFAQFRQRIADAARELHEAARPPRTPGTVRTSTSIAMFRMETGS